MVKKSSFTGIKRVALFANLLVIINVLRMRTIKMYSQPGSFLLTIEARLIRA